MLQTFCKLLANFWQARSRCKFKRMPDVNVFLVAGKARPKIRLQKKKEVAKSRKKRDEIWDRFFVRAARTCCAAARGPPSASPPSTPDFQRVPLSQPPSSSSSGRSRRTPRRRSCAPAAGAPLPPAGAAPYPSPSRPARCPNLRRWARCPFVARDLSWK